MSKKDINLEILKVIAEELKSLKEEIVYLGGATISLFVTEPEYVSIRETFDVDCVVEVTHRQEYEAIAQKLRKLGFKEDNQSSVICRFRKGELILDVMPTDGKILGFSNIWYQEAFKNAVKIKVSKNEINVFDYPYLIATKIEAFKGRGKGQYRMSHDIEDIVTLFDGRSSIAENMSGYSQKLKNYLSKELKTMIEDQNFVNSLDAHISDRENINGRKKIVLARINEFIRSAQQD